MFLHDKYVVVCKRCLRNVLIGAFNLTKNADSDQSSYSGYGIGFDVRRSFNIN